MNLAIMQPYFLPYVGYFQLANCVDTFVIYDNLKYTKKGWINRNRYLSNGEIKTLTIPLAHDSDFAHIGQRVLAPAFDRKKELNRLGAAYRKAAFLDETMHLLENIFFHKDNNLFGFIHHSLLLLFKHLDIKTKLLVSSRIDIDHELKSEEKVIALCLALNADTYINPPGGIDLYQKENFSRHNLVLKFLQPQLTPYPQGREDFIPALSIIDLLMHTGRDNTRKNHLSPAGFL